MQCTAIKNKYNTTNIAVHVKIQLTLHDTYKKLRITIQSKLNYCKIKI